MSGEKLNNYSSTDNNITQMQLTEDGSYLGKQELILTNRSTTSKPAIEAGSIAEVNGSLYKFSTEEPISTTGLTATSGDFYVKLVPSSSECTASFSTVTPVLVPSKNGWYESTSSNDRITDYVVRSSGSSYTYKLPYKDKLDFSLARIRISDSATSTTKISTCEFNFIHIDYLGEASTTTSRFTVTKNGIYRIDVSGYARFDDGSGTVQGYTALKKNGTDRLVQYYSTPRGSISAGGYENQGSIGITIIDYMSIGDYITVEQNSLITSNIGIACDLSVERIR